MNTKFYFTSNGYQLAQTRITNLEGRLRELQALVTEVGDTGGQWHDNSAYDHLVIDIRGVNKMLADEHAVLNNAIIIEPNNVIGEVGIGTVVTISINDGDMEDFEVLGYGESDAEKNKIAYNTPLARLIMRAKPGDVIHDTTRKQKRTIKIISVKNRG